MDAYGQQIMDIAEKGNSPFIFKKSELQSKPIISKLEILKSEIEKMYAVELLEYHDKNFLSGDTKARSEVKQNQLIHSIALIEDIRSQLGDR